jgi:hypothetical protein
MPRPNPAAPTGDAASSTRKRLCSIGEQARAYRSGTARALRKRQREERLAARPAYEDAGYVVCDALGVPVHPECGGQLVLSMYVH